MSNEGVGKICRVLGGVAGQCLGDVMLHEILPHWRLNHERWLIPREAMGSDMSYGACGAWKPANSRRAGGTCG